MYYELWNILWNWRREFTTKEFSVVFVSPNPNKVLYDMAKKGMLERIGWGRYKVNSPEEYLARRTNITEAYDLLKLVDLIYSFTGPDAVFFWTKGGYQVDRFFGFYPIHLKVMQKDLEKWVQFFNEKKHSVYIEGDKVKKTLFGVFFVLYPKSNFESEIINGFHVDLLEETVEFCKKKIYSYEPALEMLNEIYHLGLDVEYKEIKTNY
ncbi:MAG: hypothetical protein ACTSPY_14070 [Candidatus Helarchaeota archaeon]